MTGRYTMARTGPATLAALILTVGAVAQKKVEGILDDDTVWTGDILVTGDIEVPLGAKLTIREGTSIRIATKDARADGWNPDRVEIHVRGMLRILGSTEQPVEIAPAGGAPYDLSGHQRTEAPWHGVILHHEDGESPQDQIENARFSGAFAALQIPDGGPRIVDTTFVGCRVGIEVGSAYRNQRDQGGHTGAAQPEILRCRFAGCYTGVFIEGRGSPDVARSVFYHCTVGVGNDRPGYCMPLAEPGAVVDHCALLHNGTAVIAPAVVHDSILAWNGMAAALSAFHTPFAASIDHTALHTNLLFENKVLAKGEIGLATNPVVGDPLFGGRLDDLQQHGPPLMACLELQAGSPARARASDGSDLGPMGAPGIDRSVASWKPAGEPVRSVLALPYGSKDKRKRISQAAVGLTVDKRWWIAPPMTEAGTLDVRAVFGADKQGWVAVPLRSGDAPEVTIELNGDIDGFVVQLDGKRIAESKVRQRFGEHGAIVTAPMAEGDHVLAVHAKGWTTQPRLALSVKGAETLPVPEGEATQLIFKSGKLRKSKGFRYVELSSKELLNWSDSGRPGLVKAYGKVGKMARTGSEYLGIEIVAKNRLRVTGVPTDWEKPILLVLSGLRRPDGTVYPDTGRIEAR